MRIRYADDLDSAYREAAFAVGGEDCIPIFSKLHENSVVTMLQKMSAQEIAATDFDTLLETFHDTLHHGPLAPGRYACEVVDNFISDVSSSGGGGRKTNQPLMYIFPT